MTNEELSAIERAPVGSITRGFTARDFETARQFGIDAHLQGGCLPYGGL